MSKVVPCLPSQFSRQLVILALADTSLSPNTPFPAPATSTGGEGFPNPCQNQPSTPSPPAVLSLSWFVCFNTYVADHPWLFFVLLHPQRKQSALKPGKAQCNPTLLKGHSPWGNFQW